MSTETLVRSGYGGSGGDMHGRFGADDGSGDAGDWERWTQEVASDGELSSRSRLHVARLAGSVGLAGVPDTLRRLVLPRSALSSQIGRMAVDDTSLS